MATVNLPAKLRTTIGKGAARKLRAAGSVPAIIYGHGREPQALSLDAHSLQKLLDKVSYKTTVFEVDLGGTTAKSLIREIQRHPFLRTILHVDFQELVAGERVTVKVPLVFVGTPEGVRVGGGILDTVMRELEIAVDPLNIPNHIDVDVTNVSIGHSLHVSDIIVPEGVEVLDSDTATICVCSIPKEVVEAVPAAGAEGVEAAEAPAEPELIRKVKPDAEGEGEEKEKK